jgi:hypothetical protein
VDELDELQAILYEQLDHNYHVEKIGLLAYLALHAMINYWGYRPKMEVMTDGNRS